jgi:hypothetical protein
MAIYERGDAEAYTVVDDWEHGISWYAHPEEKGTRTSHAIALDDGVWLLDPLDAPDVDAAFEPLGTVEGVVVCSSYHARDAQIFAERHDVPLYVPEWVSPEIDSAVTVERFCDRLAGRVRVFECTPFPGWAEALLYDTDEKTLYVPDSLGTGPAYTPAPERIGLPPFRRFGPPRFLLDETDPDRILCGHGAGVFTDPVEALETSFDGAVRRLPRVLWNYKFDLVRGVYEVVRG